MKKSGYYAGCYGLLFVANIPFAAHSSPSIKVEVDYAAFKSISHNLYVEVYYSIRQSDLIFLRDDKDEYHAEALVQMKVFRNDSLWSSQAWRVPSAVSDTSQIRSSSNIVDVVRYAAPAGAYRLVVNVQDSKEPSISDSAVVHLKLPEWSSSRITLSDIELAASITKAAADKNNVFYKNTYDVVPNPGAIYGRGVSSLFYYVEAYNLNSGQIGDKFKTVCLISESEARTAKAGFSRTQIKSRAKETSVEVGAMNIDSLQTGSYYLHYGILDTAGNWLVSTAKKFFIYNPASTTGRSEPIASPEGRFLQSLWATMEEDEVDREIGYIRYLLHKEDAGFLKSLQTVEAKRKFLFHFWEKRDSIPSTAINEYRDGYLQRVGEANDRFKALRREGWRTDRGRVYLIYGNPQHVERFQSTTATKPYEIWSYYGIEGGVDFIFADLVGFKDYSLLHSTKIGEIRNENWRELIYEHAR
jgi:GWxTD domain-containing protein